MERPFELLSRRRFLYGGLGLFGLVTASGIGGLAWVRSGAPDVDGLHVLSASEFRTFQHLVAATLPADGPIPADGQDHAIARAFDEYLADQPETAQTEATRALLLVELAPIVWGRHHTTFSRLNSDERAAYWRSWPTSERLLQRQISLGFRKFMNMLFYDRPETWPHIGYGGPSLARLGEPTR